MWVSGIHRKPGHSHLWPPLYLSILSYRVKVVFSQTGLTSKFLFNSGCLRTIHMIFVQAKMWVTRLTTTRQVTIQLALDHIMNIMRFTWITDLILNIWTQGWVKLNKRGENNVLAMNYLMQACFSKLFLLILSLQASWKLETVQWWP